MYNLAVLFCLLRIKNDITKKSVEVTSRPKTIEFLDYHIALTGCLYHEGRQTSSGMPRAFPRPSSPLCA